jgi:hypothetical protein
MLNDVERAKRAPLAASVHTLEHLIKLEKDPERKFYLRRILRTKKTWFSEQS